MKINNKNKVVIAAFSLCAAAAPVQAHGTWHKPFPIYAGTAKPWDVLPYGRTPQQVADAVRQEQEKDDRANQLETAGEDLLTEGNYMAAEVDFRQALAVQPNIPFSYVGLAEALDAQGKVSEALQAYQTLIFGRGRLSSTADEARTRMGYAIVLSQLGRWPEAVAVYEKELPNTPNFGVAVDVHFDAAIPKPTQLQALAHVATGLQYVGHGQSKEAYVQFYQALHLDSQSPYANYYYGFGWRSLDPKDKERLLNAQQAKAALQKAEKIGNANVKAAAQKALKELG